MRKRWDIQMCWNPWLSFGIHIDHKGPFAVLHLPGTIVAFGNIPYPGFVGWSLRNVGPTELVGRVEWRSPWDDDYDTFADDA
jgi:hypothetical protein